MAVRPIDANELLKKFAYSPADTEDEQVFNAAARKIIREMPTLTPPNEALTIEQLREMNGEPAWWDNGEGSCWGIISVDTNGRWAGIPFFRGRWKQANFEYDIKSRGMTLYRRPPEGEEGQNVSTKAPGQWVSVEERLPEPGERVIATDGAFVGEGYMNCYGVWCRPNGMRWNMLDSEVTHWIPLPALPDRRPPEGET